MRKWFGTAIWLGVFALTAATVAGSYGAVSWALDLFAHFRPHLVAVCFVWMFLALFQRRFVAVVASAALMAVNAAPIVPYVVSPSQAVAATPADVSPLRVMTFNMHGRKTQRAAFLDYVQAEQPDVVLLTEVPNPYEWLNDSLGADYPYRFDGKTGLPHDVILFSRWPIVATRADRSVSRGFPVLAADLCQDEKAGGACVRLIGLHAIAPFGQRFAKWQETQFAIASRFAREAPHGQAIVAGDLNMTPWSPTFRHLLEAGGLRDTALGRSITATWASRQPIVGLPIDHVLASPQIVTRHYEVGPDLGSDHLPVIAELAVPRPAPVTISRQRSPAR